MPEISEKDDPAKTVVSESKLTCPIHEDELIHGLDSGGTPTICPTCIGTVKRVLH